MPFNTINNMNMRRHIIQANKKLISVLVIIAGLFSSISGLAQVNVIVNIIPPYSPYYADYSGSNASKVLIMLQNTGSDLLKIKLTGKLESDNGIRITTRANYSPLQPIILNPHQTKQLNGIALKDVFDLSNVNVYGVDKVKLAQSARLPEGNYTFCLQAVDYNRNQVLSASAPLGCTTISITYPEPPILINPIPFSQVPVTNPQFIPFAWTNPGTAPIGTQYTIQVAEMPDMPSDPNKVLSDPNQVLNATSFPLLSRTVSAFSYLYTIKDLALTPGKKYAWRVIAADPSGKTLFKNNGVSAASIFVYGQSSENPLLLGDEKAGNSLNIIVPDCGGSLKKPVETLGPHSNINFNWLWKEQIDSLTLFGTLDSNIIKHYTTMKTPKGLAYIKNYALEIDRVGNNVTRGDPGKSRVNLFVTAPLQSLEITPQQAAAAGLITGQNYILTVKAIDSKGKVLSTAKSCTWALKAEDNKAKPKLNISGRLTYAFDKANYHGANNASITLQWADTKIPTYKKYLIGKILSYELDPAKNSVSTTTDAAGHFNAQITLAPSDTGKDKYLLVRINNPYYTQPDSNIRVLKIPALSFNPASSVSLWNQDTLKLGDIKTDVYNYSLTVNVKMGFPQKLTSDQQKSIDENVPGQPTIFIDNSSIDTLSKVPDGTSITLYRKAKAADIPYFEGQTTVIEKSNNSYKNDKLQQLEVGKKTPVLGGFLKVAEAKTASSADGKSSTVIFSQLICNLEQGDEYYLKADFPNNERNPTHGDMEGPEQAFRFQPKFLTATHFDAATDYHIISTKPPMANVRGTVMYQWPSTPGVLHPYANQHITITMHVTAKIDSSAAQAPDCQTYKTVLMQTITDANGKASSKPFNPGPDNIVVGEGMTDSKGVFNIEILDFMQMGQIGGLQLVATGTPQGETCDQKQASEQKHLQDERNTTGAITGNGGFTTADLQQELEISQQKVQGGGVLDFTKSNAHLSNSPSANTFLNSLGAANSFGANKNTGPSVGGQEFKSSGGPNELTDDVNTAETSLIDNVNNTTDRYFSLGGIYATSINSNSLNTPGHFVVQPFGSVDLGIIVTNVNEISDYTVNVKASNGDNSVLAGAKLVVFRSPAAKQTFIPDGEGSVNHPNKMLLNPTFYQDPSYKGTKYVESNEFPGVYTAQTYYYQEDNNVNWIIDTALTIGNGNSSFSLNNLRLFNGDNSQYLLQITPNLEGSGGYFSPVIVPLKTDTIEANPLAGASYDPNGQITVQINKLDVTVGIAPSRIAGRVLDKSSAKPIPNALVNLFIDNKLQLVKTDENGYYELLNFQPSFFWLDNAPLTIISLAEGYDPTITYPADQPEKIQALGHKYYNEILLAPSAKLLLKTVDSLSTNTVVPAYAMRDDSTVFQQTKGFIVQNVGKLSMTIPTTGIFTIPVTAGVMHKIIIYPTDPAYFNDTVYMKAGINDNSIRTVKMTKRDHRITFRLVDQFGNSLGINGFKISINNDPTIVPAISILKGTFNFDFENVSVNNYSIQITGIGYVPRLFNLKNEETKEAVVYTVTMVYGATLSGRVTLDNKPVQNARVYLDYNGENEKTYNGVDNTAVSLLEAHTDGRGEYVIKGIPMNNGDHILVHATMDDAAYTILGDKKTVAIANGAAAADFSLSRFSGPHLTNLWGFPLTVESITQKNNFEYYVTGIVDLSYNKSSLKSLDPENKVRINNILFRVHNQGLTSSIEPAQSAVPLDAVASLKMRYLNKYNVSLRNPAAIKLRSTEPLAIERDNTNTGVIRALVNITDNSFNYPSSYLSFQDAATNTPISFYLDDTQSGAKTVIDALYVRQSPPKSYHLSNIDGNALAFLFIGFKAFANPDSSFIAGDGKFHLDVTFKGTIPHSDPGDVDVRVKNLVLDGHSITPSQGTDSIVVNLQTWKLIVKDWTVDPKLGGLYSNNVIVRTGILDVPASTFNLRSDLFVLTDFDLKKVNLGGIVNLNFNQNRSINLLYDDACGSDHSAHWRFSALSGDNNPVATIPLPLVAGKISGGSLGVNYFQFVSYNNENILNLVDNPNGIKLYNNNKFTFYPLSISSSSGSFTLGGNANIDVPRAGSFGLNVVYTQTNGFIDMNPGNFLFSFEGPGYVQFSSDNASTEKITTSGAITTITGSVVEPAKLNPVPCTLSFGAPVNGSGAVDQGTIILQPGYNLVLDGESKTSAPIDTKHTYLTIGTPDPSKNGMFVQGNDWTNLKFSGLYADPKSGSMVAKKPNYSFEVLGDISANSDSITMDQATPLGKLHLTYDFATKELDGLLHMDGVKFGNDSFSGDIEVNVGPDGMLMLGAGELNTGTPTSGFGTFTSGFLIANKTLTDPNIALVTQYSKAASNKCWLDQNKTNFTGFFFTGGYDIINEHTGVDIGIASVYFNAVLGIEASVGINFNNKDFLALLGAHGDIDVGLNAITGSSVSGGLSAHLTAGATYQRDHFVIFGDAGVEVKFTISQYVPFVGTKSFAASKGASISFELGGNKSPNISYSLNDDTSNVFCNASTDKN